jgi:hypothetical protein
VQGQFQVQRRDLADIGKLQFKEFTPAAWAGAAATGRVRSVSKLRLGHRV